MRGGYERLYNIQQGDIWGAQILDHIAPVAKGMVQRNQGFSTYEEQKYENKSTFLKDFYSPSPKKPNF